VTVGLQLLPSYIPPMSCELEAIFPNFPTGRLEDLHYKIFWLSQANGPPSAPLSDQISVFPFFPEEIVILYATWSPLIFFWTESFYGMIVLILSSKLFFLLDAETRVLIVSIFPP